MRFAVIGGDRRSALLCRMLHRDGHKVQCYALERAELPGEIPKAGCLQSCVYGADCVILPVPAEKGQLLNTPLSAGSLPMAELIGSLWKGQLLIGGQLSESSCLAAIKGKLLVADLMTRADFVTGNAALTAEGAVGRLIQAGERSLWGSRVLVSGYGRIGKLLSRRLLGLGARVTVAARRDADRALAGALGCESLDFDALEGEIGEFDFIVNTVPARVITEAMLCCVGPEAVLLELASPPGGFDRSLAENIGLQVLTAPGLPGSSAPASAALLMKQAVYDIIRQQEE